MEKENSGKEIMPNGESDLWKLLSPKKFFKDVKSKLFFYVSISSAISCIALTMDSIFEI